LAVTFLQPGPLDTRTGGTIYNRRIVEGLERLGRTVDVHELDRAFPFASAPAVARAVDVLAAVADGGLVVVDSLAVAQLSDGLLRNAVRLRLVALMHLPVGLTPNLGTAIADELGRHEARALAVATRIVVTGRSIVGSVSGHAAHPSRVAVVEPGVDPASPSRGSGDDGPLQVLCVASVVPGKGHDLLLGALAALTDRPWHLTCAGSLERDRAYVDRVVALARASSLVDRVSFAGELDDAALAKAFARSDLFVLPTRFETYGMAVAEAIAHGLPVVSTATGAIPSLVGDLAGLVVAPDNVDALRGALALVMDDKAVRRRFRAGALRMRTGLRTWATAAREFDDVLEAAARA
jgi:glycosyltransferase involved in cell wall biosynthesis